MADLTLRIKGEDAGAQQLLRDTADGAEQIAKSTVKWQEAMNLAKRAGSELLAFTKESFKALMEEEKALRSLTIAAGKYTETFKAQADAFERNLGVQGESVMKMQAMLLQFGEAPAAIEGTTQAILDLAAATGKDAVGATAELLSAVKSGKSAFKEYGVEMEKGKTTTEGLATATAALTKKFGGAAQAEGDSLEGALHKTANAFEEVQKGFAGMLLDFVKGSGVLSKLNNELRIVSDAFKTMPAVVDKSAVWKELGLVQEGIDRQKAGLGPSMAGQSLKESMATLLKRREELRDLLSPKLGPQQGGGAGDALSAVGVDRKVGLGGGGGGSSREPLGPVLGPMTEEEALGKMNGPEYRPEFFMKQKEDEAKALEQQREKEERDAAAHAKKLADVQIQALKDKQREAESAGMAFGGAIAGGITSALAGLMSGEEKDAGSIFLDVLASVVGAAGTLIGTLVGGPLGAIVGGSLGGLGSAAIRGAGKKHDGGWIGAPRYHSGGWPGLGSDEEAIIAQQGERMLSRREVGNMGGPAAVDSAARGGGNTTVVQAWDSQSIVDFFSGRGGRGVLNSERIGRTVMRAL